MKKLVSLLCVISLIICSLSVAAFAVKVPGCKLNGDVDSQEGVQAADARLLLRYAVGLEKFSYAQAQRADYDGDGKVTSADARHVLRVAVNLEKQMHSPDIVVGWTKAEGICPVCGEKITCPTKLEVMMNDANAWAEKNGFSDLIKGSAEGNELILAVMVDGIWSFDGYPEGAFDGFLTKMGEYVKANVADTDIVFEGKELYKDGKLQNHALKEVLFSVGDGFFYKIANLDKDGIYGKYALNIGGEDVNFTVKFLGSDENIGKVKDFAEVISRHIYAVPGDDLTIGVIAPDALKSMLGENPDRLNEVTIAHGFGLLAEKEIDEVFGSQVSAVNKVMKLFCEINGFVNKVLGKVTVATVELEDGTKVDLFKEGAKFVPDENEEDPYKAFVNGIAAMFSDELKATKVGAFSYVDGAYTVPVYVEVNMENADIMAGNTITETINVEINVFNDVEG